MKQLGNTREDNGHVRRVHPRVWICLVALLCSATLAHATTYYVDGSHELASDSNAGTDAAPWLTIQHAASVVRAGDTVIVKAGTYDERATISSVDGTATAPIVFCAQPRRSVNMRGFVIHGSDFVHIEGFNISNTIKSAWMGGGVWVNGSGVEVVDCYIAEIPGAGVQFNFAKPWTQGCVVRDNRMFRCQFGLVAFGTNHLIEGNEIERPVQHVTTSDADYARFFGDYIVFRGNYLHGARNDEKGTAHLDCLQIFSDNGYGARNCVIEQNHFESFSQGVMLEGKIPAIVGGEIRNVIIRNNIFLGTPEMEEGWGVLVGEDTHEIYVYNNTFMNMDIYGVGTILSSSATVCNNVFYNCKKAYFAKEEEDCSIVGGNNLIFPVIVEPHYDPTDLRNVDPKFVDYANANYRLAEDSPAIDAGIDVGVTDDKDGNARPMGFGVDIGAYEFVPSGAEPPSLSISAPSSAATKVGPVSFTVTYTNATSISLAVSDITLNTTGNATGSVQVSGSGASSRTVTVSSISGTGTLSISVAAGSAANDNGSAPAAGPSAALDVDNEAPVITLLGENPTAHSAGETYVDAGATASDNRDGNLTSEIQVTNNVNADVAGSYTVVYRVTDELGNSSGDVVRTVNVIAVTPADTTKPTITVLGENPVTLEVGTAYVDAGATATDNVDGDLSSSIVVANSVDSSAPGTYSVRYDVSDAAGNSASASRTVNVVDTTKPVITLLGDNPTTVEKGSTYVDAGATATDNVDGDLTSAIVVTNPEKSLLVSSYTIGYEVTDSSGNMATASRTVNVIDTTPATWYVDSAVSAGGNGSSTAPFQTISEAVAVSLAGRMDTILVAPGTYAEAFELAEDTIIESTSGAYHTWIMAPASMSSGAAMLTLADNSVVRGFTFVAGPANVAVLASSGVSAALTNNVMCDSKVAVQLEQESEIALINNTFYGNGIGVQVADGAHVSDFRNNAVASNSSAFSGTLAGIAGGGYNCYKSGQVSSLPFTSDFFAPNPAFVDAGAGNYHLCSYSPCRDRGDSRTAYADRDGSRNDIGADGGTKGVQDLLVPEAVLTTSATKGAAPLNVSFDASDSNDEWGIAEASWDFDQQDGIGEDATGLTSSCTFTEAGSYVVTLTVCDHNGLSASTTATITVGSEPPLLHVSRTPMAGPAPLEMTFSADASDPDGGGVSVEWDFDGDGVADSTGTTATVVFDAATTPGSYLAQATATDDEGETVTAQVPFTITYGTPVLTVEADPTQPVSLEVTETDNSLAGATLHMSQGAMDQTHVLTFCELPATFRLPSMRTVAIVEVGPVGLALSQYAKVVVPGINPNSRTNATVVRYVPETGRWTQIGIRNVKRNGMWTTFETNKLGVFAVQVLRFRVEDVNDDGTVDALDIQQVVNAALGISQKSEEVDIDANGAVDAIDVQMVINAALGL